MAGILRRGQKNKPTPRRRVRVSCLLGPGGVATPPGSAPPVPYLISAETPTPTFYAPQHRLAGIARRSSEDNALQSVTMAGNHND